jgi:DNA-binding CsgD family transcriptional regulator
VTSLPPVLANLGQMLDLSAHRGEHGLPWLRTGTEDPSIAESRLMLGEMYRNAVDAITSGVFAIEASGRLQFANRAGQEVIRGGHWIQVVNGALRATEHVLEAASLTTALRRVCAGFGFRLIARDAEGAQAIVCGAPILLAKQSIYPAVATALVWVTPIFPGSDAAGDLADLFGLTGAEQQLAGRLIAGDGLSVAAGRLQISINTARTQLKSIFNKTGLRTQAALLSFVARLSALRAPV